jgi:GNAT superfamily N-acetyltransferase
VIRAATFDDLPAVLDMVTDLHASTKMALEIDPAATMGLLRRLVGSADGLLLVAEADGAAKGFLAATVGVTPISFEQVGMELGWWAGPEAKGAGLRLLVLYERWAKSRGCRFVRMSTPPHNERAAQILGRRGFFVSEVAWAKAI